MGVGGLIALGLLGGAAGLYLAKRKPATASGSSGDGDACKKACAALDKAGVPSDACMTACGIASTATKIISGFLTTDASIAADDADNKAKNGDIELDIPEDLKSLSSVNGAPGFLRGSVLRYKNGCTPFEGSPGWSKCAPGTHSMRSDDPNVDVFHQGPFHTDPLNTSPAGAASRMFSGGPSDVTTGIGLVNGKNSGRLFWKGKPFTCPNGVDWSTHDSRAGADGRPLCTGSGWQPNPNSTPPPRLNDGQHMGTPSGDPNQPRGAHGGVTVTDVPR